MEQIVVFSIDHLAYGLPLNRVVRVIHSLEIRKLPKAPQFITGIINVKGQIIPVVDIRLRFGMISREADIDDQIIIAFTGKRDVALMVDTVTGVKEIAGRQYSVTKESMPFAEYISGVVKIEDELILIYDLEEFLSLEEEKELSNALNIDP
jgi:purine-binding chemotaxis protein CheW